MNRKELRKLIKKEINEMFDRDQYPPMSFDEAMLKISEIARTSVMNKSRNMPGKLSDDDYYQQILNVLRETQKNSQLLPGEKHDVFKHGIGNTAE